MRAGQSPAPQLPRSAALPWPGPAAGVSIVSSAGSANSVCCDLAPGEWKHDAPLQEAGTGTHRGMLAPAMARRAAVPGAPRSRSAPQQATWTSAGSRKGVSSDSPRELGAVRCACPALATCAWRALQLVHLPWPAAPYVRTPARPKGNMSQRPWPGLGLCCRWCSCQLPPVQCQAKKTAAQSGATRTALLTCVSSSVASSQGATG